MIPGANNAAGGITIDMVRVNSLEIAPDRKTVTIGPGARWLEVYKKLEANNLLVVGGRVADVGVGVLVLGGKPASPDLFM